MANVKWFLYFIFFTNVVFAQELSPNYTIQIREKNGEIKETKIATVIPKEKINKQIDKLLANIRSLIELTPNEDILKQRYDNTKDLLFIMLTYPKNVGLNFIDSYDENIKYDIQNTSQKDLLRKAQCSNNTTLCNYYKILYIIVLLQDFKQTCEMKILDNQDFKKLLYESIYYATYDTTYNENDVWHLKFSRAYSMARDLGFDSLQCFK